MFYAVHIYIRMRGELEVSAPKNDALSDVYRPDCLE